MRLITDRNRWIVIDRDDEEVCTITQPTPGDYRATGYNGGWHREFMGSGNCLAHCLEDALPGHTVLIPTAVKQSRHYHG